MSDKIKLTARLQGSIKNHLARSRYLVIWDDGYPLAADGSCMEYEFSLDFVGQRLVPAKARQGNLNMDCIDLNNEDTKSIMLLELAESFRLQDLHIITLIRIR